MKKRQINRRVEPVGLFTMDEVEQYAIAEFQGGTYQRRSKRGLLVTVRKGARKAKRAVLGTTTTGRLARGAALLGAGVLARKPLGAGARRLAMGAVGAGATGIAGARRAVRSTVAGARRGTSNLIRRGERAVLQNQAAGLRRQIAAKQAARGPRSIRID